MVHSLWSSLSVPAEMNGMESMVYKLEKLKKDVVGWIKKEFEENKIIIMIENQITDMFLENFIDIFYSKKRVRLMEFGKKRMMF